MKIKFSKKAFVKVSNLILTLILLISLNFSYFILSSFKLSKQKFKDKLVKEAQAVSFFHPTNGILVTGSETALSNSNVGSWRGLLGNDSNYWQVARVNPGGLNLLIYFDGVELYGANKMIITIEDSNIITGDAYIHQICDWVDSTGVDNPADTDCTGGGWRTLNPRKTTYTNIADTIRSYEIYNGYFSTRAASPGTVINTPLSNFIEPTNKRVLIRVYSTVNSTTNLRIDWAQIEVAIDPFYQNAGITLTSAGATTNFISDLIGAPYPGPNSSDNVKLTIPMPAANQPIDFYFSFKNVKTYTGMNTILVVPEICVSNTALTFDVYLWNFTTNSWTKRPGTAITGTACTTDTEYGFAFNQYTISGFNLDDYISNGEIRVRFLTNNPATVYNIQLDRIYIFLGSVNTNSSACEISWGTGTASDCVNTRDMNEGLTANPTTLTWQTGAVIEYPAGYHPLDNDDDITNGEYAFSSNLDFPVTLSSNMSVTAIHYAGKYRSNATSITVKPSIRVYGGLPGIYRKAAGSGWRDTPGSGTNAATTYSYFDTFRVPELQVDAPDHIDTVNNRMNMRLRTSASTNTAGGVTRDWDFAMMSIRWVEEPNRVTITKNFHPTNGILVTGSETALSNSNVGSWRGLLGNDSNYWQVARVNPGGLNLLIYFDGVELYGANKMIITIEDSNIITGDAYIHQICDWVDSTGVDNPADTDCTGGGWRTLNPRKTTYTNIADTIRSYEIYNGYFSTRAASPGTVINTPLSNFIEPTNKRVLIRVYSTVNSTTNLRIDWAQIEVAIDPFYQNAGITLTSAGATTNFISDLIGAPYPGPNSSDNVKLTIPMPAANQPIDFYFSFKNVKTYTGMNTILVVPEICVSNTALTFDVYLWNFTTNSWTKRPGTAITGTACTTDTEYGFAFNQYTISGFNLDDYISNGEIRVRFLTNNPATVYNIQLDRIYIFLGSVNTNSSACEISWGTGTASDCVNTRDMNEGLTANPTTLTWQTGAVIEYPAGYHPLDNDDDITNGEYAFSSNLDFPVTLSSNMSVTAIHYAGKYRSNATSITVKPSIRVYGGLPGIYRKAAGSGWRDTPGSDTNAATTYSYFDTFRVPELQVDAPDHIDTVNNRMNMRLRTSASTNTAGGVTRDWDFAMMSIRWVERPFAPPTITCSFSATSTSFSSLSPSAVSTSSPDITITVTSSAGFIISVNNAGDGTNPGLYKSTAPTYLIPSPDSSFSATATLFAGTDGYGIQATTTNSNININVRYNVSGYTVGGLTTTTITLASSSASVSSAQITIKHKASISALAPIGNYQDTITYSCTSP
ncbi:MAG: hypothetical protein KatS3mg094_175 [Candidatus Parcubacteria bacterium]|nr:MAG: hypothetical protein KatS3mg094_175 [Candidatus Parcubacteria bacterium]